MNNFSNEIKKMIDKRDAERSEYTSRLLDKYRAEITRLEGICGRHGIGYRKAATKKIASRRTK